ncbi:MAG: hypothetical protein QG650_785 [Patescibacteria group bacterium]|nr:hypothetical protein [Patescibacteria group bacterium]
MKSFSKENPFRKKTVGDLSEEAILGKKFSIFPYLVRTHDGKLENLGTGYRIEIPKNREFSEWFDASRNVSDNFHEGIWKKTLTLEDYVELVRTLAEKGFLILER